MADANNIYVAGTGTIYVGPVGTAGPTNIATALNAAFKATGFTSEDGVTITPSQDVNEIRVWQSQYPARRVVTGRTLEAQFNAMEWTQETVKMVFSGGTFVDTAGPPAYTTYTPPATADIYERALVIETVDGAKVQRLHIPRVMVSDVGDIQWVRADAAALPITLALVAADATTPFTLIQTPLIPAA